ncbi:MAG TPA: aminotransferase class I/II-fold pyridoxal phosphate-dependent enzyme [Nocardioidaceae bacterium]|nr:aminotransferase class I/II-fold pyridoxal phosphate-dependent enzyme [Nocardioidaceae bacterium]
MTSTPFRHLETTAVHAGMAGVTESGSHVPTIDLSSTNPLPSVEEGGDAYEHLATGGSLLDGQTAVYQRLWQPGVARFEAALAELEQTSNAVAFSSGMAALSACLIASVQRGRPHVVALRPLYGGSDHVLATGLLGTQVTWCERQEEVAAAVRPDTGLVVVETPANPTCDLVDLESVVAAAAGVPVLVDNTFATPVLQQPARHGAGLVLHSATKFLGGHGDVVGGVVACDEDWAASLRQVRALTGGILHPFAAYLLHRGLRTLPVRVRAQQATAAELAHRLGAHDAVAGVHYPGLPGTDPHGVVGRQMHGGGCILALELAGGYAAAARFVEGVRLATHAVSLGGVDTLVQHPASLTHRPVAPEARPGAGVVRISVGLEHVDDLTVDLLQALDATLEAAPTVAASAAAEPEPAAL